MKKHPILCAFAISELLGMITYLIMFSFRLTEVFISGLILGTFMIFPILLTLLNIYYLILCNDFRISRILDLVILTVGTLFSCILLLLSDIMFDSDWNVVLVNSQLHTPIYTKTYPTIICLLIIGLVGYFILSYIKLEKMPPLIIVLCISFMYIGVFECGLWIIQLITFKHRLDSFLLLLPFNFIIIVIKTLRFKIKEWKIIEDQNKKQFKNKLFNQLNNMLMDSTSWNTGAFILMWIVLGGVMCILVLFNQQPDYFIKAYLETSDWNLSQRVAPQNIYCDQHYLCTVAAGGHQKVVKPVRLGVRHGHQVIVNRQLCIANAFEQILEERVPIFHKHIRYFYDTYGFEVAKLIHNQYTADFIYYIMKPLEWIFLIVIYCFDTKPENRIAVQYSPLGGRKNVV